MWLGQQGAGHAGALSCSAMQRRPLAWAHIACSSTQGHIACNSAQGHIAYNTAWGHIVCNTACMGRAASAGNFDVPTERLNILKGWFNETLPVAPINRISLLRLDGDLYTSTRDALQALYHKVT